jgi:hypothetical protein
MAQDIFSSNIQQNAPGLVYATPKSIEASDNSLGGIAKALNTIIPAAVNLDESRVMSEASDLANTMANEYKLGSETHINNLAQEKQRLEQDLATSGESTEITSRLNDIEAQLTLAQEQGRIGPGEFRARMMKAGQDLTNRNPAYQLEIANKMNAVFGATGVTSILAQDSTLLQTKANALIARKALKIETIETYEDTTGKSDEYINEKYKYYKDLEGTSARIKQVVDTMKNASDIQKRQVYNTFMDEGGYPQFANGIYAEMTSSMRAIGANPNSSLDQKIKQSNDVLNEKINLVLSQAAQLPSDATEGQFISTNLVNQIKAIQKEMLEETDKTVAIREVQNASKLIVATNELNMNKRFNVPEIEMNYKLFTIIDKLKSTNLNSLIMSNQLSTKLITDLNDSYDGVITKDSKSADGMANPQGAALISQLTTANRNNAIKDLADNGELTTAATNLYISDLEFAGDVLSKDALAIHYDKHLTNSILQTDDKVMDYLETVPRYNTAVNNAINTYTQMTMQSLAASLEGKSEIKVSFNKSNSSLFIAQDDPIRVEMPQVVNRVQNNLMRLNKLIRINAKISGKSLEEEAEKIISEDFEMLRIK